MCEGYFLISTCLNERTKQTNKQKQQWVRLNQKNASVLDGRSEKNKC
jgi:hypothetical protein